jgi:hypothetical protein
MGFEVLVQLAEQFRDLLHNDEDVSTKGEAEHQPNWVQSPLRTPKLTLSRSDQMRTGHLVDFDAVGDSHQDPALCAVTSRRQAIGQRTSGQQAQSAIGNAAGAVKRLHQFCGFPQCTIPLAAIAHRFLHCPVPTRYCDRGTGR